MSIALPTTHFLSPERATPEVLARHAENLQQSPLVEAILDTVPDPVLILNIHRQIVFTNDKLLLLTARTRDELIGMRPGEALGCAHAGDTAKGCGTSKFCQVCGAAKAVQQAQLTGVAIDAECRLNRRVNKLVTAMDLHVWIKPIQVEGESYMVVVVHDITDEKRRQVLERMFFHDVLNAASGLREIMNIWSDLGPGEVEEMVKLAKEVAVHLHEEIQAQRDLAAAERGDLYVEKRPLDVKDLLEEECGLYRNHSVAAGKELVFKVEGTGPTTLTTSSVLLRRVLGNLIKNALEASIPGQKVTVSYQTAPSVTFLVHNEGVMPPEVQMQIFQRSFSTKGTPGRGIGSYSVKMLTEQYLGGTVCFVSHPSIGTQFSLHLPTE